MGRVGKTNTNDLPFGEGKYTTNRAGNGLGQGVKDPNCNRGDGTGWNGQRCSSIMLGGGRLRGSGKRAYGYIRLGSECRLSMGGEARF